MISYYLVSIGAEASMKVNVRIVDLPWMTAGIYGPTFCI